MSSGPNFDPDRLASAEAVAGRQNPSPSGHKTSCPFHFALEIEVNDHKGQPLLGIPVAIRREGDEVLKSKTDGGGIVRFEGLEDKEYLFSLYALSGDAWEPGESVALDRPESASGPARFSRSLPPAEQEQKHVVKEGECATKLGDRYGFTAQALRTENQTLLDSRADLNMLIPGDEIRVPARRIRWESSRARERRRAVRLAPTTRFYARFLNEDGEPRAGIKFLASIQTLSKSPQADITGDTDDRGVIEFRVPLDTDTVTIELKEAGEIETHLMRLSHMEPASTMRGLQGRLRNLGYGCGTEDGVNGPVTTAAIRLFQLDHELDPTGNPDAATRGALLARHGS
jgi:N-acetylmuramoyl-L-alanine amidase